MMLHICQHSQSSLALAFSRSMWRAVKASLNPTGSPRSFRPVGPGVGSVVLAVREAEPIVVIAGPWCGPEGVRFSEVSGPLRTTPSR
jgi:hypothetical protein